MTIALPSRLGTSLCLVLTALASQACTDLPTGTESFQLEADGQLWAAVVPPEGLPVATSWLADASVAPAAVERLRAEVEALEREASAARTAGNLERAERLRQEAVDLAISVMESAPHREPFTRGLAAIERWQRSVGGAAGLGAVPPLMAALEAVEVDRRAAEEALEAGDPRTAALRLTRAADRIRDWAPQSVALRVLDRVELHLAAAARSTAERERAAHLVQSARQELVAGSGLRAMQRALYALQLAGGNGLGEAPEPEHSRCGEYGC